MGIHHVLLATMQDGVEDEYIHAAALSWLVGDDEAVSIERMNSYHGSPIHGLLQNLNAWKSYEITFASWRGGSRLVDL